MKPGVSAWMALNGSTKPVQPAEKQKQVLATFRAVIFPLRRTARRLGYCLAIHGSLARDIDLVAVPWTKDAVAEEVLVGQLIMTLWKENQLVILQDRPPYTPKPHGRHAYSMHFSGTYLDLSVMPRHGE